MRRFPGILVTFLFFIAATHSHALSSDARLLSLVPPGAQVVAGMDSPPPKGLPGSFVLMTHNNVVDLNDAIALTGADSTRSVNHAVIVAKNDTAGYMNDHSLLWSGHFDQSRIYKSAVEGGARVIEYRGLPVLVIQPFARERGEMDDVRWFAVLDSNLLLFGSVLAVGEELDRYVAHDTADPILTEKLSHLRHDDETWTMISRPARNPEIERVLTALDPQLGRLAGNADAFLFGIRCRRQVEFEYEATTTASEAEASSSSRPVQSFAESARGTMLLPSLKMTDGDNTVRGVVKIPTSQFTTWLEKVSSH